MNFWKTYLFHSAIENSFILVIVAYYLSYLSHLSYKWLINVFTHSRWWPLHHRQSSQKLVSLLPTSALFCCPNEHSRYVPYFFWCSFHVLKSGKQQSKKNEDLANPNPLPPPTQPQLTPLKTLSVSTHFKIGKYLTLYTYDFLLFFFL